MFLQKVELEYIIGVMDLDKDGAISFLEWLSEGDEEADFGMFIGNPSSQENLKFAENFKPEYWDQEKQYFSDQMLAKCQTKCTHSSHPHISPKNTLKSYHVTCSVPSIYQPLMPSVYRPLMPSIYRPLMLSIYHPLGTEWDAKSQI